VGVSVFLFTKSLQNETRANKQLGACSCIA